MEEATAGPDVLWDGDGVVESDGVPDSDDVALCDGVCESPSDWDCEDVIL